MTILRARVQLRRCDVCGVLLGTTSLPRSVCEQCAPGPILADIGGVVLCCVVIYLLALLLML